MQVRILGAHHLETATSRLPSLLVDGVLALDAGSLSASLSLQEQQQLKAILVTHRHYDHARDLPLIGLATAWESVTDVCAPEPTLKFLADHLFDGDIYPRFFEWPSPETPSLRPCPLEPLTRTTVHGYRVMAVPVKHASTGAVGYEVLSDDGGSLFYTGDTGSGLGSCWEHVSPRLLVIEVSLPDSFERRARQAGHLTPSLLEYELAEFRQAKGYLPRVVAVHMHPGMRQDLERELGDVSRRLGAVVIPGQDGLSLAA